MLTRPSVDSLPKLFKTLGLDYGDRVLPSICNEVLKAVVAQYDAAELLTLRDQVSYKIRDGLQTRAKEFNIELDDVSITHVSADIGSLLVYYYRLLYHKCSSFYVSLFSVFVFFS